LNWSPIAYNRFIRLIRFIKYPFEVIEAEKRRIQQTLKARLQNLHREFNLRADAADHDKVKQRLKTLDMIKQLTAAVEGAAGLEKEPDDPPKDTNINYHSGNEARPSEQRVLARI